MSLTLKRAGHVAARIFVALLLLLTLATLLAHPATSPVPTSGPALVRFERIPLDISTPTRRRLGNLVYLGGWRLTSEHPRFGGISAIHIDSGLVTALTDSGWILRFPAPGDGRSVAPLNADPLGGGPGSPRDKKNRDTEGMAIEGGQAWIAYERRDAIWRYRTGDWRAQAHAEPPPMRRWPNNSGAEGIVRLRDGRFMVFSEAGWAGDGSVDVLLFDGDPAVQGQPFARLGYRPPPGFLATDAAELPDGRLLVLNRQIGLWTGFTAKLVVVRLPKAGGPLEAEELATLRPPLAVDNMEGLSVAREQGRTIVWIASDDNFSPPLQRTLLLKFALTD